MNPFPTPLETYDWDNTWIEHSEKSGTPRALYIGDSISLGTRQVINDVAQGSVLFDGFHTSKALDHPYFIDALRLFALQENRRDLILLNNGLHGFHLSDDKQYPITYRAFVKKLLQEYPDTPLALVLTTAAPGISEPERVLRRNEAVQQIAQEMRLPVADLYTASLNCGMYLPDGLHFTPEGYRMLARVILDSARSILKV